MDSAPVSRTLMNLSMLAQVQLNDKLLYDGVLFSVQPNTYARAVQRWWQGASRTNTFESLQVFIENAMQLLELLCLRGDTDLADRLLAALPKATQGLKNMRETYRDDLEMSSKLDLMLSNVDAFATKMRLSLERH